MPPRNRVKSRRRQRLRRKMRKSYKLLKGGKNTNSIPAIPLEESHNLEDEDISFDANDTTLNDSYEYNDEPNISMSLDMDDSGYTTTETNSSMDDRNVSYGGRRRRTRRTRKTRRRRRNRISKKK